MNIFTKIKGYFEIGKKVSQLDKEIETKESVLERTGRKGLNDYHKSRISVLKMKRDLLAEQRKRLFAGNYEPMVINVSVRVKDAQKNVKKIDNDIVKKPRKTRSDKGKKRVFTTKK